MNGGVVVLRKPLLKITKRKTKHFMHAAYLACEMWELPF